MFSSGCVLDHHKLQVSVPSPIFLPLHIVLQLGDLVTHSLPFTSFVSPDVDLETSFRVCHLGHPAIEVHRHLPQHRLQLLIGRHLLLVTWEAVVPALGLDLAPSGPSEAVDTW